MQDKQNHITSLIVGVSLLVFLLGGAHCASQNESEPVPGASQLERFLPQLRSKNVGMVVNHTSLVGKVHLVDTLIARDIRIKSVFSPEHGFRGNAPDGAKIFDSIDPKTGVPLISLYGANRKPTPEQMQGVDIMIFDLQDVGTRFYTYISTMHLVMEACAEAGTKLLLLDRPNPNGDYVDGPMLDMEYQSFVGMHPIPVVHGLTVGELAGMINGENWLNNGLVCDLEVITVANYDHSMLYDPPVKPSPNLPDIQSIRWYPSLCLFEGTVMSIGRGTKNPFQKIGYPDKKYGDFEFTPRSIPTMSTNPKHKDKVCFGIDLSSTPPPVGMDLSLLLEFCQLSELGDDFFIGSFNRLAGSDKLKKQILEGKSWPDIRLSWQQGLTEYLQMRKKYLLYPDFK